MFSHTVTGRFSRKLGRNDWRRQGNESTTFWSYPADKRIQINPEIRNWIMYHFWLSCRRNDWRWRKSAVSERKRILLAKWTDAEDRTCNWEVLPGLIFTSSNLKQPQATMSKLLTFCMQVNLASYLHFDGKWVVAYHTVGHGICALWGWSGRRHVC